MPGGGAGTAELTWERRGAPSGYISTQVWEGGEEDSLQQGAWSLSSSTPHAKVETTKYVPVSRTFMFVSMREGCLDLGGGGDYSFQANTFVK